MKTKPAWLIINHVIQGHLPTLGGPPIATFSLCAKGRFIPCMGGGGQVDRMPMGGSDGFWRSR